MPLGKGYTVEEQLTGKAEVGGVQFDVFERLRDDVKFAMLDSEGEELVIASNDSVRTPDQLKLTGTFEMKHGSIRPCLWPQLIYCAFAGLKFVGTTRSSSLPTLKLATFTSELGRRIVFLVRLPSFLRPAWLSCRAVSALLPICPSPGAKSSSRL